MSHISTQKTKKNKIGKVIAVTMMVMGWVILLISVGVIYLLWTFIRPHSAADVFTAEEVVTKLKKLYNTEFHVISESEATVSELRDIENNGCNRTKGHDKKYEVVADAYPGKTFVVFAGREGNNGGIGTHKLLCGEYDIGNYIETQGAGNYPGLDVMTAQTREYLENKYNTTDFEFYDAPSANAKFDCKDGSLICGYRFYIVQASWTWTSGPRKTCNVEYVYPDFSDNCEEALR